MKTITVDGKDCVFFLENCDDGGVVINTAVPDGDAYLNFRAWFSDPTAARLEFDAIDAETAAPRVAKAQELGVSGVRHYAQMVEIA